MLPSYCQIRGRCRGGGNSGEVHSPLLSSPSHRLLSCSHQTHLSLLPEAQREKACPLLHPPWHHISSCPRSFFTSALSPQRLEFTTFYRFIFCISRRGHTDPSELVIDTILPPSRCVSGTSNELADSFDSSIPPSLCLTQSSMVPFLFTDWPGENSKGSNSLANPEPSLQDPQPADWP